MVVALGDAFPERWTLPIAFNAGSDTTRHALLERAGELIAICSCTPSGPRLVATRGSAAEVTATGLTELLEAVGGRGPMVLPAGLHRVAEEANRGLGGQPLTVRMPLRLYRHDAAHQPEPDPAVRSARAEDREHLLQWTEAFSRETGLEGPDDPETWIEVALRANRLRLLEEAGRIVACAQLGCPVAGQARIGLVYVPEAERRRGFASRLVQSLTAEACDQHVGPCLFTDARNEATDRLYRRLGYRPIEELLHLDADDSA